MGRLEVNQDMADNKRDKRRNRATALAGAAGLSGYADFRPVARNSVLMDKADIVGKARAGDILLTGNNKRGLGATSKRIVALGTGSVDQYHAMVVDKVLPSGNLSVIQLNKDGWNRIEIPKNVNHNIALYASNLTSDKKDAMLGNLRKNVAHGGGQYSNMDNVRAAFRELIIPKFGSRTPGPGTVARRGACLSGNCVSGIARAGGLKQGLSPVDIMRSKEYSHIGASSLPSVEKGIFKAAPHLIRGAFAAGLATAAYKAFSKPKP